MSRRGRTADFFGADPLGTADRLEALAADLRRLAAGHVPSSTELAEAPTLRDWNVVTRPCLALVGEVEGHPSIADHQPAVTSELCAIDPGERWARTMSRFYRLRSRDAGAKRHG
ncbi:DUF6634 family protein [Devosia sp.]|uniref:DUF6634 family protein n=1 Tax=Devosia sp. TaxID=1871048 RepID=UPI003F72405B